MRPNVGSLIVPNTLVMAVFVFSFFTVLLPVWRSDTPMVLPLDPDNVWALFIGERQERIQEIEEQAEALRPFRCPEILWTADDFPVCFDFE